MILTFEKTIIINEIILFYHIVSFIKITVILIINLWKAQNIFF